MGWQLCEKCYLSAGTRCPHDILWFQKNGPEFGWLLHDNHSTIISRHFLPAQRFSPVSVVLYVCVGGTLGGPPVKLNSPIVLWKSRSIIKWVFPRSSYWISIEPSHWFPVPRPRHDPVVTGDTVSSSTDSTWSRSGGSAGDDECLNRCKAVAGARGVLGNRSKSGSIKRMVEATSHQVGKSAPG